jgi:hypothetical protein
LLLLSLLFLFLLLPHRFRAQAFYIFRFCLEIFRFCFRCCSRLLPFSFSRFRVVTFRLDMRWSWFVFTLCLLMLCSSSVIFVSMVLSFNYLC